MVKPTRIISETRNQFIFEYDRQQDIEELQGYKFEYGGTNYKVVAAYEGIDKPAVFTYLVIAEVL